MSPTDLEKALRDLPKTGTRVKSHAYRQVWRFEFNGKPFYLKFYPRHGGTLKRLFRGSPALREFTNLQALQRAKIPAPRAIAQLSGFVLDRVKGDAVILEGLEPSVQLDQYLNDKLLAGETADDHRKLALEVMSIVKQLGAAGLGHADLHLGNFLMHDGKLFLLDGYAVRTGGMRMRDILRLGHSVSRFATRTDLLRAWRLFTDAALPKKNPVRRRQWRKFIETTLSDNRYFGRLTSTSSVESRLSGWSGQFHRHCKFPRRWSPASKINLHREDWQREWARLLARIQADQLEILKRSKSGDVLAGEIVLAGLPVSVVVKRNRRRKWYRHFNEIGRGGRARRAWKKAWSLVARDIPTAWPLLMMERRTLGYITDSVIVFERVRGTMLSNLDLDSFEKPARANLFRRLGRTLRLLEAQGLKQYDSKSTNWIIADDPKQGPVPVIVDVDGIRRITPAMWPIDRLLRSMRQHDQYTPEDSKHLCLGYAPFARLSQEATPSPQGGDGWGEGEIEITPTRETSPVTVQIFPPHPDPLPAGERGQEARR